MDHLEDVKSRIRERLKKLDLIKEEYKNLHIRNNSSTNTTQYSEMIQARLKHISNIKTEIFNNTIVHSTPSNPPDIEEPVVTMIPVGPPIIRESSYSPPPLPPPIIPIPSPPTVVPSITIPSPPTIIPPPPPPIIQNPPDPNMDNIRRHRQLEREQRTRSAAASGCGCRGGKK